MDNPSQQQRINDLIALSEHRLGLLDTAIQLQSTGDARGARSFVTSASGKPVMDRIRNLVTAFRAEEEELLQKPEAKAREQYRLTIVMIAVSTAAGLIALFLVARGLQRRLAERAASAAALEEQREWFRTTLSSIGDAVLTTDTNAVITYANNVAESLTGWSAKEAVGRPLAHVFKIINEDTREPADDPAIRALREGQIVELANHTLLITRNGDELAIDDAASPIKNEKGEVYGVVLIFRNLTERRQAERELVGSEARFRQLAETIPHMIWVADEAGRLNYVNSRYRRYFGMADDVPVKGERILDHVHPDECDEILSAWNGALRDGSQFAVETRLRRAQDAAWRWHLVRSVAVHDPAHGLNRWFGSATDVHDQRMLQIKLAEEDRRKDEFLAVLGHELRNPLAPLKKRP